MTVLMWLIDKAEGVVVYHPAGNVGFKKTIHKDEVPKGQAA